jgi:uncharacterized OsmC-like protein
MNSEEFTVRLSRKQGYGFDVDFVQPPESVLQMDEPPPLGAGEGPSAKRVLAAAVGNCLSASLLFCLNKARVEVDGLNTTVRGTLERNEQGRMRITRLEVELEPDLPSPDEGRLARCLEIFEDYCVVTESVRRGIEVGAKVNLPSASRSA